MKMEFHFDGKISSAINKFGNFIFLSLLWLVGCLPIITIGSSTAALYYTTVKVLRKDNGYISKEFFRGFKHNLKDGTIFTVIYLAIAVVLYLDVGYVMRDVTGGNGSNSLFLVVYNFIILLMLSIAMYIFPILSRFKMRRLDILKLSFYIAFRHFLVTICLFVLQLGTAILIWLIPIPCILFMPAAVCYIDSLLIEHVLECYMAKPENNSEKGSKWYYASKNIEKEVEESEGQKEQERISEQEKY